MNNTIYYIPSNIPNIQYHKLLHPITKQTKRDKKLLKSTKPTENDKKSILNLWPIQTLQNLNSIHT